MKQISCKSCSNISCYIYRFCSDAWLEKIDETKSQILHKKNQNIINEGGVVLGIHFVKSGKVKVFFTGRNDKTQIVRFAHDGHIIGHRGLGKNDRYPISASAMEDSVTCYIQNETLNQLFRYNKELVVGLMEFYSRELRRAQERIKNLTQMNVREKIVDALLALYENFGLNEKKELKVSFSRMDLACIAGTSCPQVALQLGELQKEDLIQRRGNKIIMLLNIAGLKKIVSNYNPHQILA